MPGREYDLELRLAYGSEASIGVGTRLRLSVPSSGGSDGGDGGVVGKALLEAAFGGHMFKAAEGTLGAVLARDLLCEWEWVKALEGGEGRGDGASSVGSSSGGSEGEDGALRGVVSAAHSSGRSDGRSGTGVTADRVASGGEGGEGGNSVQAEMGAMAWVVGAFSAVATLLVGCLVARARRRSRSAESEGGNGGSALS